MFSSEIFAAYDVIFNVWLQSKEVKVSHYRLYCQHRQRPGPHSEERNVQKYLLPMMSFSMSGYSQRRLRCAIIDYACIVKVDKAPDTTKKKEMFSSGYLLHMMSYSIIGYSQKRLIHV